MMISARAFSLVSLASLALASSYSQKESYSGSTFLNGFNYQAIADPTNGRV